MKKKILALALLTALLFAMTACSSNTSATQTDTGKKTTATVPVILNQTEYTLYQNIFYNGYADSSTGPVTKKGIYAVIQDAYNNVTRHYVWGYLDNTLCCDWQWEFVPVEGTQLPTPGSEIQVTGNFEKDDNALDKYWIQNAIVTTETEYTGETAEVSMLTMSDTLERVQMLNVMNRKEGFEGKSFTAYGRIAATDTLEDPYYNGSWTISFQTDKEVPATGTIVRLRGTIRDGQLAECGIEAKE